MNLRNHLAETLALLNEPVRPATNAEKAEHRRLIDAQIERELLRTAPQPQLPLQRAA